MSTFITKSFLGHSTSKNHGDFCLWQANLLAHRTTSSALNSQFQSAIKNCTSDVNLYYQIVSRPFFAQKLSKFFACGGQLLGGDKTYNSDFIPTFNLIINFKTASGNSLYFKIASRLLAILCANILR